MENLDLLLQKEKMHKYLDEIFKGIPREYTPNLLGVVLEISMNDGVSGKEPVLQLILNEAIGVRDEETKQRMGNCMNKIYSLGYCIGKEMLEISKPENGEIKTDKFNNSYSYMTKILENIVTYFNPAGIEDFRKLAEEHLNRILSSKENHKKVN